MKKIYYLKTCSTCIRILKELNPSSDVVLQDIKTEPLTSSQIDGMKALAGSYEKLFSRRAQLYKSLGLKNKTLTEDDYKNYILEHYTFLSRPVTIIGKQIFVGNSKKTIEAAKTAMHG